MKGSSHMHTPPAFAVDSPADILAILRRVSFGHLITPGASGGTESGLTATALPFVVDDDLTQVRAHFARANRHWREIDGSSALLIVPSVDAYVSPRWYPSKVEHGKVVPTWNYEVVHLHGTIEIHHEAEWKRQVVDDLTDHNEVAVSDPDHTATWKVSDAPADFIQAQLKAIVGLQLNITAYEGNRKLSQNKPESDRVGAIEGLARSDRLRDLSTGMIMGSLDS